MRILASSGRDNETCARVKSVKNALSNGRDSPVAADGEATIMGLTHVLGSICAGGAAEVSRRHPNVLSGISNFHGCYSTVLTLSCPAQTIIDMLAYLSAAMSVPAATVAAGKSIRLVLIASAGKLTKAAASPGVDISTALTQCMEAALSTNNASLIASVSEGCARVGMQVHDVSKSRATLSAVTSPTILLARSALDAIVKSSSLEGSGQAAGQVVAASQAVTSYLGVLRELIRCCDGPSRRTKRATS